MKDNGDRKISRVLHWAFVGSHSPLAPPRPKLQPMVNETALRKWIGPLLLILVTCPAALILPTIVYRYKGDLSSIAAEEKSVMDSFLLSMPLPSWAAAKVIAAFIMFEAYLLLALPGETIYGPATSTGERPVYKDNGMLAWFVTHVLWLAAFKSGAIDFGVIYDMWGSIIATLNVVMMPFCLFLYIKGRFFPTGRDTVWTGCFLFDFFQGMELHPVIFGINLKQLCNCRVSMMAWSLSQLCFAQAQYNKGELSPGMVVTAALTVIYLGKFFWWESGYFASIDIIHDRCGYYIIWGVMVWVPSFYCFPAFIQVESPAPWSAKFAAFVFVAGLIFLWLNYWSDYQRQVTRSSDGEELIWGKKPELVHAEYMTVDGHKRKTILLASGFWGISRHFNYIPELALAFSWCAPAGATRILGWSYFLFLLCLLTDRAVRDDKKCAAKYGKHWEQYCKKVPYRMVPKMF